MLSCHDPQPMMMLVRKLESIATLPEEERQAILSLPADVHPLRAGQDIARDGDKPVQCCLLLDGWAFRYKLTKAGRRQILSFHVPGDVPDLQTLHIPTLDHNLAALTPATVASIPHESLRDLTTRFPNIAALLWRDTLVDAGIFRAWIVGLGQRSAYEHMAHLFCELYMKLQALGLADDHRCPMPLTQVDLADALGLSPVHVNRVLKEMRGKGLITLRRNTLVIAAWNELLGAGEFDPRYLHLGKRAAG